MKFYTSVEQMFNNICVRGYDENGKQFFNKVEFRPTIYLPSNNPNSKYRTLKDEPLEEFQPGNIKETKDFLRKYEDVDNFNYYGMKNPIYNYITEAFPGEIKTDFSKIRIGYIDIETECESGFPNIDEANETILIINLFYRDKYYFFSIDKWGRYEPKFDDKEIVNVVCSTEEEMLEKFLAFWRKINLDIVSGWYSEGFDIIYLINRMIRLKGMEFAKKLSPWGSLRKRTIPMRGKEQLVYDIVGINHLDYKDLDAKFSLKVRENGKLNTIAEEELGIGKLDYSVYGSLKEMYRNDFQHFCDYNVRDVEILPKLEDKMRLIELVCEIAYYSGVNMIDTLKNTRVWDQLIYRHLMEQNIVVPQKEKDGDDRPFAGGYVKEPQKGLHKWIVNTDLDSLYPHLIMQYNISPETEVGRRDINLELLVDGIDTEIRDLRENYSVCANGVYFSREKQGFLPYLMDTLYSKRKEYKNLSLQYKGKAEETDDPEEKKQLKKQAALYNIKQGVFKIILNSAYGAIGNNGFRFFRRNQAEAITVSGQLSVRWAERKFNEYFNKMFGTNEDYVTTCDTDSVHFKMERLVNKYLEKKPNAKTDDIVKFLDSFTQKKIIPYIDDFYQELADFMGAYKQKMRKKREAITQSALYLAKKKYAYLVNDLEGVHYKEPILKITGIEIVRSSTPQFCRNKLKDAVKLLLEFKQEELRDYIKEVEKEFNTLSFEDIAMPRGANNIQQYMDKVDVYKKGTPIHVRACILHNFLVKQKGLQKKYELVTDGDKIKFCYLKLPNPIFENIIAAPEYLPEEFGLREYIDYKTQFEKTFISPIKSMMDAAGWDLEEKASFMDLL